METSCSANRIISFSRIEDGRGGKYRVPEIKMGVLCLFSVIEKVQPPDSGGWSA